MMQTAKESSLFNPLSAALRKIQFLLESDSPPQVMVARQTREEFMGQSLPSHCIVRKRKLRGSRQIANTGEKGSTVLAHWPKDGLVEDVCPMLLFVLNGEADIRFSDYVVSCQSGDCIFLPARIPKLSASHPRDENIMVESDCDILYINPNPLYQSFFSVRINRFHGEKRATPRAGEGCWFVSPAYCSLFEILAQALQTDGFSKSTFYLIQSLLSFLKQEVDSGSALTGQSLPSESVLLKQYSPIQQATQYIRQHFNRPLSIIQVARWVGLSKSVFVNHFREETGVSFNTYLTQVRLEHAKVLLSQSLLHINKISISVGLSPAQFRNLIRTQLHCSPREYRKAYKQKSK